MKKISDNERALIDEVDELIGGQEAAELECVLGGSLTRFHNMDKATEDAIRGMAAVHGIELPC